MTKQHSGEQGVTVTIFGREQHVPAEKIASAAITAAQLSCHDALTEADQDTLSAAYRILQRLASPAAEVRDV